MVSVIFGITFTTKLKILILQTYPKDGVRKDWTSYRQDNLRQPRQPGSDPFVGDTFVYLLLGLPPGSPHPKDLDFKTWSGSIFYCGVSCEGVTGEHISVE